MHLKCGGQEGRQHARTWKRFKISLAGNWLLEQYSCRVCSKRGPGLEEVGGEKGRQEIIIWMEVAEG